MAKIYAYLIAKGLKTIGDVPDVLAADVKKLLVEMGIEVDL